MNFPNYNQIKELEDPSKAFDLSGRIGLITGGAGKMGQEFAIFLSRAGATVILADINEEVCEKAAECIRSKLSRKIETIVCDVSDESSVQELFDKFKKQFTRLDFLISNIMGKPKGYYKAFDKYPLSTWKEVHDINLTGTFLCCREAEKIMAKRKGGSIIFTSSIYGLVAPDFRIYQNCSETKNPYGEIDPLTTPAAYSSSKGGLIALAKYLAVYLAPKNIRVNVLTPGGVFDDQEKCFHQEYLKRTPLGRMAVWSDFNGAILFLVSDASRYMTGANLVVDGGWTTW